MALIAAHGTAPGFAALLDRLKTGGHEVARVETAGELFSAAHTSAVLVHTSGRVPEALFHLPQALAERLLLFIDHAGEAVEPDLLAFQTTLGGLVVKQGPLGVDEMAVAVGKLLGPRPLGLEHYLPGQPEVQRTQLIQSIERGQALMALEAYIAGHGLDSRRVAQILTIADELITNAFYHAPVDGIGGHPFSHVSRMDLITCRPNKEIELAFARADGLVAVSVRDRYGSLEQPQLRTHLAKAATNAQANFKVSSGSGGVRIGLITAVRAASALVFNVIPGELTECIGLVETSGTYRQFLEAGKTVQLFSLPGSALG